MKTCFPAISTKKSTILILGSMPGEESLKQQRYYAHPRNAFWYIMSNILNFDITLCYETKTEILKNNNIALWDVLKKCNRPGSLDSSIDSKSIEVNDFKDFYQNHPLIENVFFNGAKAAMEYNRRVLPAVINSFPDIKYHKLTSTSPAMAMRTRDEKLTEWQISIESAYKNCRYYS